jgi:hypothetical protein
MARPRIVLALVLAACRPSATQSAPSGETETSPRAAMSTPTPAPAPPWSVDVADGSGNVFHCEHAVGGAPRYEYRPVTPAQSSTGTYSGGDPRSGPLDAEEVDALWRLVEAAAAATAGHTDARAKGTVALAASGPTDASVVLTADAGAELVAWLRARP